MRTLTFNKEKSGWYIDLPEWKGSKGDLAMVSGADTLLDRISNDEESVKLSVALTPVDNFYKLKLTTKVNKAGGGIYKVYGAKKFPKEIWLCDVTKFVFGGHLPPEVYFYPTLLT